jgi:hypothetical protein
MTRGKRRKRKNEGLNRRKDTLIKEAYELGEFDGIDVALIICKHGRYTTYGSRDHASWPPSIAEIVSKAIACLKYTTSTNTDSTTMIVRKRSDVLSVAR